MHNILSRTYLEWFCTKIASDLNDIVGIFILADSRQQKMRLFHFHNFDFTAALIK